MALLKSFTASHAQELVRIAKKYNSQLNLAEVVEEYSQKTNKKDAEGSMNDYLEQLEGALERALNPKLKKGVQNAPKIDTENQFVTHDPGLEKEGKPLRGEADRVEEISKNTVIYKPEGSYIIDKIDKSSYAVNSELELRFYGTYHGKKANFSGIKVKIVAAPIERKGHKYVKVRFAYDQKIDIEGSKNNIYFLNTANSFYVKIK